MVERERRFSLTGQQSLRSILHQEKDILDDLDSEVVVEEMQRSNFASLCETVRELVMPGALDRDLPERTWRRIVDELVYLSSRETGDHAFKIMQLATYLHTLPADTNPQETVEQTVGRTRHSTRKRLT